MKILVVQESDWLTKGPHQQHHIMERISHKHIVKVIDYENTWKDNKDLNHINNKMIFLRKKYFNNVSKVIKNSHVCVIRPGYIRIPFLDILSMNITHARELLQQHIIYKPDIVVGFGISTSYTALKISRKYNVPYIYYVIDALHTLTPYKSLKLIAKVIEKKIIEGSNKIIVINEELKNYVINMGADIDKVEIIRAGIDIQSLTSKIDKKYVRKLQKKYNILKKDFILFYMGTIFSFSGLLEVISEFSKYKHSHPFIKLLIVGNFHKRETKTLFLNTIRKNNLEPNVILVNRVPYDQIPSFLSLSTICLLPAHNNEVMKNIVPIKMYEYMGFGKTVISTRLPGIIREFGYNNGIIYINNPIEVLSKVTELMNYNYNFNEYGKKGIDYVSKFDWNMLIDEFIEISKKLCLMDRLV